MSRLTFFLIFTFILILNGSAPGTASAEAVPNEFLVVRDQSVHNAMISDAATVPGVRLSPVANHPDLFLAKVSSQANKGVLQTLRSLPGVRAVQPNYLYRALFTPDDPSYASQWNFAAVHASDAWDLDTIAPLYGGDPSVVVAVIDTGVAYEDYAPFIKNPDFNTTNFVAGYDFANDDSHPNDDVGHGTHVTATIAESTNNGLAAAGLAFNVSVMPIKVLNNAGIGTTTAIASGIDFARTHGADVINLSLGGTSDDPILRLAIAAAYDAGIIIVAATGNDGTESVYYPARYDNVIAVGATRFDNTITNYSNFGVGIDLVAPGGDTEVDQNNDGLPDGILQQTCATSACTSFGEANWEGTSMATPHVSAAAALLLSSGLTPESVPAILFGSVTDLGPPGYDSTFGWGLLDIAQALRNSSNDTSPPTGSVAIANGATYIKTTSVTLALAATDTGTGVIQMSLSNDGVSFSAWEPYDTNRSDWNLVQYGGMADDGTKTVYVKFQDGAGNISQVTSDDVILDTEPPDQPILTVHAADPHPNVKLISGVATSVRHVVGEWSASQDALSGVSEYRVLYDADEKPDLSAAMSTDVLTYTAPEPAQSGTMYLHVFALDGAGNSSSTTFRYVYRPVQFIISRIAGSSRIAVFDQAGKRVRLLTVKAKQYGDGIQLATMTAKLGEANAIVVAPEKKGNVVTLLNARGKLETSFLAYDKTSPIGVNIATGDLAGDARSEVVVSPQSGAFPIRMFSPQGRILTTFFPFGQAYTAGITLAVYRDSDHPKIVAATQSSRQEIGLYDSQGRKKVHFFAFSKTRANGVNIATGDFDGDGTDEILAAPVLGQGLVKIFTGQGKFIRQIRAYQSGFRGGLALAAADLDGDGADEIVTIPAHGAPRVMVFSATGKKILSFFADSKNIGTGFSIAALL